MRLLFYLGFGTGYLLALEFSGQFCSSEMSKTIKGGTFVGRSLAEITGEDEEVREVPVVFEADGCLFLLKGQSELQK